MGHIATPLYIVADRSEILPLRFDIVAGRFEILALRFDIVAARFEILPDRFQMLSRYVQASPTPPKRQARHSAAARPPARHPRPAAGTPPHTAAANSSEPIVLFARRGGRGGRDGVQAGRGWWEGACMGTQGGLGACHATAVAIRPNRTFALRYPRPAHPSLIHHRSSSWSLESAPPRPRRLSCSLNRPPRPMFVSGPPLSTRLSSPVQVQVQAGRWSVPCPPLSSPDPSVAASVSPSPVPVSVALQPLRSGAPSGSPFARQPDSQCQDRIGIVNLKILMTSRRHTAAPQKSAIIYYRNTTRKSWVRKVNLVCA